MGHLIYLFKGAVGPQVLSLPLLPHGKGGSFLHHMVLPWHDVSHRPQTVMEFNLSNRAEPLLFINHLAGIPRCSKGKLKSLCLYTVCLQHLLHACPTLFWFSGNGCAQNKALAFCCSPCNGGSHRMSTVNSAWHVLRANCLSSTYC